MSFFDEPVRSGGARTNATASSSKTKLKPTTASPAVKPRIIKTVVTQVAPPPRPRIEHRRTSELIRNGRAERPVASGGGLSPGGNGVLREPKRAALLASTPPRKKAKIAPKWRAVSSGSSSDESSRGARHASVNAGEVAEDGKAAEAGWKEMLAKRPLFNVTQEDEAAARDRSDGLISARSIVEANLTKYKACEWT